jgi:hypothetical protein
MVNCPASARERCRQHPALDLGCQGERLAALTPLEQVGEVPVDDHHVPEGVRGRGDVVDGVRVGDRGQQHLQHPDDVAPVRHRSQHAGELACRRYLQPLGAHHLLVGRTGQRHRLGGVPSPGATALDATIVAQPDHRVAAGIGDEEDDFLRGQPLAELRREHVHSSHRRRDLHRSEQRAQLQAPLRAVQHAQTLLANPFLSPVRPATPPLLGCSPAGSPRVC